MSCPIHYRVNNRIMCYSVYISTDSVDDLSKRNSELVIFKKVAEADSDSLIGLLDFPNKWYVGSKSGCSCTFRHLAAGSDFEFEEHQDWCQEEQDNINATLELYSTLDYLISSGYKVDLLDQWYEAKREDIIIIDVSLDTVSQKEFRLFENHKFKLRA
jgi:hypothetical protein